MKSRKKLYLYHSYMIVLMIKKKHYNQLTNYTNYISCNQHVNANSTNKLVLEVKMYKYSGTLINYDSHSAPVACCR